MGTRDTTQGKAEPAFTTKGGFRLDQSMPLVKYKYFVRL